MTERNSERDLRQEYLNTMKRFEAGEPGVSASDVFEASLYYYLAHPLKYVSNFFRESIPKTLDALITIFTSPTQ